MQPLIASSRCQALNQDNRPPTEGRGAARTAGRHLHQARSVVSRFLDRTSTVRSGLRGFRFSMTSYPSSQRWHQISSTPGRNTMISLQFGHPTSAFSQVKSMDPAPEPGLPAPEPSERRTPSPLEPSLATLVYRQAPLPSSAFFELPPQGHNWRQRQGGRGGVSGRRISAKSPSASSVVDTEQAVG